MRADHAQALEVYERALQRKNLAPQTCALLLRTARRFLKGCRRPLARVDRACLLLPSTLFAA